MYSNHPFPSLNLAIARRSANRIYRSMREPVRISGLRLARHDGLLEKDDRDEAFHSDMGYSLLDNTAGRARVKSYRLDMVTTVL